MFTHFGVITALVHVTLPVMVIMLAAAISHIDPDYERAAESLGAGPIRAFLTITLPLIDPRHHRRRDHGVCLDVQRLRYAAADRWRAGEHGVEPRLPARICEL